MAGGKRKVFNRKTRNKRQNETENTEENSSAKALRDTSSQGKKLKLDEAKEVEEKRPVSVQALTTEPTTLIKPKLRDDDVSRKASKYVPPFSRTRKSGNTEEKSGNKSPVTRSSTRKRNRLQVLTDVAKQKLEFEDRNDETSSLITSEKTADSCPSDRIKEEQKERLEVPPAKHPKLKERVKINRHFSLNLRGKGKKKTKQNESEIEGEKVVGNAAIPVTLEENEMQETKVVEKNNEKKHQKTAKEALKDETKENESEPEGEELDGNAAMEETTKEERQETKAVKNNNEKKHRETVDEEALKDETKQNESEPEGEELDGNAAMEETKKEERQETKPVQKNYEKKHHQTEKEALKNKTKQNGREPEEEELDGKADMEETTKEERQETKPVQKNYEKKHHKTEKEALKDEAKQNESEPEEEELDGNTAMEETTKEERQETKPVQKNYEKKHETVDEKALKDEIVKILIKENKLKKVPDEDSQATYHPKDGHNEAQHSKCSIDNNLRSKKENASDSTMNKPYYIDTVVQACVDFLIQTIEAGIPIDVVASDNIDLAPCLSIKADSEKKPQSENDDACAKISSNHINDESIDSNLEYSKAIVSKNRQVNADQEDHSCLEDGVGDKYKAVHADATNYALIEDKSNAKTTLETTLPRSSEIVPLCIHAVWENDSSLKKPEAEGNDDSKTVHGVTEAIHNYGVQQKKELDTEVYDKNNTEPLALDVIVDDDDKYQEKELETNVGDGDCSDIDIVGDDENDVELLVTELHDGSKANLSEDNDVVGDGDIDVKNLGDEVNAASKADLSDDIGDDDIDLKHLGDEEHAASKADLSEDIDVVGDDDHAAKVGNPVQLEYATNVGVDNVVRSERIYAKFSDNHMDFPAAVSVPNKENHVSIINPGGRDDNNMGSKTSPNEIDRSSSKTSRNTYIVGYTATCQMDILTAISSTDGKNMSKKEETHGASLEQVEVSRLKCVKILPEACEKDQKKCTNKQERSAKEKFDKQEKYHIIQEKESSVVNKECDMSGVALSKCGEMDLDYVIDCTDSQLIGAKPSSGSDGLRYDDLNLEDLMDCSDSQLVDIENLESQALNNQLRARDGPSQALVIEDGTTLIQGLIKEVSSIKLHLMDVWNTYEQAKKRRHLTYTPVIKKRK